MKLQTKLELEEPEQEVFFYWCSACDGTGEGQYDGSTCPKCKGLGEVPSLMELEHERV